MSTTPNKDCTGKIYFHSEGGTSCDNPTCPNHTSPKQEKSHFEKAENFAKSTAEKLADMNTPTKPIEGEWEKQLDEQFGHIMIFKEWKSRGEKYGGIKSFIKNLLLSEREKEFEAGFLKGTETAKSIADAEVRDERSRIIGIAEGMRKKDASVLPNDFAGNMSYGFNTAIQSLINQIQS